LVTKFAECSIALGTEDVPNCSRINILFYLKNSIRALDIGVELKTIMNPSSREFSSGSVV